MGDNLPNIARWIIPLALSLLWLLIAITNWRIAWREWKQPDAKGPSVLPLFGALLAWGILALTPVGNYHNRMHWVWIPWLLEYGSLPYFTSALLYVLHDFWLHSRLFLVMKWQGSMADGTCCLITLYRNGDCILKQTKMPPPVVGLSLQGKWRHETPNTLLVEIGTHNYRFEAIETTGQYQLIATSDSELLEGVQFRVK